jgi:hypothetical protein
VGFANEGIMPSSAAGPMNVLRQRAANVNATRGIALLFDLLHTAFNFPCTSAAGKN